MKKLILLLGLPLAVSACGGDTAEDAETGELAEAPMPAAPVGEPADTAAPPDLTFQAVGGSQVGGTVAFTPQGTATELRATMTGINEGQSVLGHLHDGTCAELTPQAASLADFGPTAVGAGGSLAASFSLTHPEDTSAPHPHALALHRGEQAQSTHIACADIPVGTI